ncbi:uncharacterized protein B0J16DRAFT_320976 [Fusarium flagelliforme]|uniref:uncharacterized protein n=1 Tax=Fusarium flagelliforme TaxID=2675880 RepID=UPI001E8D2759|nr:uncharacterized protein B0J16DRAFT_320976 [Fusarium flagelliforme]KAH7186230.1 hypothetical protein B0J16DRAFT_320976 [Fusarium flagelliforme]
MKLNNILGLSALVSVAQAAPTEIEGGQLLRARDVNTCRAPGQHRCAVIVWASLATLGLPGSTVGGSGVNVVDGACGTIIAAGKLKRDSPGFSADFTTAYGPHLYFGANSIGLRNIGGVRYQYNGRSYKQENCFSTAGTSGTMAVDAIQCNFDC